MTTQMTKKRMKKKKKERVERKRMTTTAKVIARRRVKARKMRLVRMKWMVKIMVKKAKKVKVKVFLKRP